MNLASHDVATGRDVVSSRQTPQAPRRGIVTLWSVSLALTAALASCSRQSSAPPSLNRSAIPVVTAKAESRTLPVEVHAIGNVQAYSTVSIRSQVTGPITQVHFEEGQEVHAGDLLFTIDPRPYQAALNQAQANVMRDEAQLVSSRLEFERTSNLFASKIAAKQDYDTAEANYRALQGTLQADEAAASNAQVSLGYTSIRSPIEGRTGNLAVKQGNIVKAPDDVLVTIMQVRPIYVVFSVPEEHLPAIRQESTQGALPVKTVVPTDPNRPAQGELTFINNTVDTNTGSILLKATVANTNEILWPGQFVQVSLTLSNLLQATVVPSEAIQTGQAGEFVFVVNSQFQVEPHPVVTGLAYNGLTVVSSGLQPGESVVIDGQLRLIPGASVEIKPAPVDPLSTNSLTASK